MKNENGEKTSINRHRFISVIPVVRDKIICNLSVELLFEFVYSWKLTGRQPLVVDSGEWIVDSSHADSKRFGRNPLASYVLKGQNSS
jgi:hypothetical protein